MILDGHRQMTMMKIAKSIGLMKIMMLIMKTLNKDALPYGVLIW